MFDIIAAFVGTRLSRPITAWRDRRRKAGHERGDRFSAPCAIRVPDGQKSRWRQGRVSQGDGRLVCTPNSGRDTYALSYGSVRFLLARSPAESETWAISKDLVVYRIRADGLLLDIGLPQADAEAFRELLEDRDPVV
jgi:hypothetical protein